MQKRADGQDTDVGSSLTWLVPRCVAGPQAGAAPDGAAPDCTVAGCALAGRPPAVVLAPGPGDAGDPLHPMAAAVSTMTRQANASRRRGVRTRGFVAISPILTGLGEPRSAVS